MGWGGGNTVLLVLSSRPCLWLCHWETEIYVKDRVDGGGLEDEHLEHAGCLLTEPSLAVEIAPGEGHRPDVSVGIYKTD